MLLGIPLGVVAALHRGSFLDRAAGTVAVLGIAMPSFWLGILLIFVFSVELGWLPSGRMGGPAHYVLPVITLGAFLVAGFMRITRSAMLEVMESEFVKLARIKGLSETTVIWKHCLRNALIPVLTLWGDAGPRRASRVPWVPIAIVSVIVIMALFAPVLAPFSPIDQTLRDKLLPPVWVTGGSDKYLLGTDAFGRDILSRLIYGARVSLLVAVLALTAGGGVGLAVGIVAGYLGGAVGSVPMRVVDAAFTISPILFALLLAVNIGH